MTFSASLAHALLSQSPAHARWLAEHPDAEQSETLDLGAARHAYLLEGTAPFVMIDAKDYRTKVAQEARDAARAEGKLPLLTHKWVELQRWAAAVQAQLAAFNPVPLTFEGGIAEDSVYWTEAGVECRATPDWVALDHRWICDLKTVGGTAHPAAFARALWDKGYHLQHALYRRAIKAAHGVDAEFTFVVTETEPPYGVSLVALDPEASHFADAQLDEALRTWKRCRETNTWPAYPTRVAYAEVPGWVLSQWTERAYYEEVAR